MFFEDSKNLKILEKFVNQTEAVQIPDETYNKRLNVSREILKHIYNTPNEWDERCSFNIKHIGEYFIGLLDSFSVTGYSGIDEIYVTSYRFLCEFDFFIGTGKELSFNLLSIKNRIQQDHLDVTNNIRTQIVYASYLMPANIIKDFINDAKIDTFRNFEQKKVDAEKLKEAWEKEIESKKQEVDVLKNKLDEYRTAFNFVGLYEGFSSLIDKKSKEAFWLLLSLIGMGFLILAPLILEIFWIRTETYDLMNRITILLPVISLEVILIYFFRVILLNYRSVKGQIIQIELRQTLCQFIQSYADYSEKIKAKDKSALEKFENLIFSGIISDPEKIPSTYDGLEQIVNLVKNMKGSS